MKQKLFTLFLALAASAGTLFAESGKCGENLTWNLTDGVLTISGTGEMTNYSWDGSPWYGYRESFLSVIIEEGVTSIGASAFEGCTGLTSITIPNSVTSIGVSAFARCYSLTSVTIGNSVTSIGEGAFRSCTNLPVIDNIRYADTYLVEAVDKTLSTYTIKDGTKWIGYEAFRSCDGLTSVTIPNSVTSIGDWAFIDCSGLTSITIPNSVTSIGGYAFEGCDSLTSIDVASENPKYSSVDGVLFNKDKTELIQYPIGNARTEYTIPNSVTSIGSSAFYYCTSLTSVTIPNSVTSIGVSAFARCYSLTSVTIPNSVTSIGGGVFARCRSLTSVTIPNSVTSIGDYAFYDCSSLTSVTIPNSVTSIGDYAFARCYSLTSITCEAAKPPTCGGYVFSGVDKSIPLYVPAGSVATYKAAYQWEYFGGNIQPIQAPEADVTDVDAEPTDNSVVIEWPKVDEATVYTIEIKKNGELICTLTFNELGQLQGIAFAKPSRNGGRNSQVRMAIQTATGWQYTISGLDPDTEYTYSVVAKKNASDTETLYSESITFTTKKTPTSVDEIQESSDTEVLKFIKNGQLFILRNGEMYNATGILVK